jgi:hypothetical protein
MSGTQAPRWRFLITPKWLGWHLFTVLAVWGMLWLGDWQLHRAESGNALSWAYTFEWPIFAIFGVVFWAKTIRDEFKPPVPAGFREGDIALPASAASAGAARASGAGDSSAPGTLGLASLRDNEPADEDDAELAAYNAYLARLHKEVKGHGKWHGLR